MNGEQLRTICEKLGLSAPEMAKLLGASVRTYYRWEEKGPPLTAYYLIVTLLKCPQVLHERIADIRGQK